MADNKEKNIGKNIGLLRKIGAITNITSVSGTFLAAWLTTEPLSGGIVALGGVAISELLKRRAEEKENEIAQSQNDLYALAILHEIQSIRSTISLLLLLGVAFFLAYLVKTAVVDGIFIVIGIIAALIISWEVFWPEHDKENILKLLENNLNSTYQK